jgi:hypothetical protein
MHVKRFLAAGALVALAACSSRGGSVVPTATPAQKGAAPSAKTHAQLTIAVPLASGAKAAAASRRLPRYVSPSSTSLSVAVNGGTASTYGLTPQSPGCVTQVTQLQCTFSVVAPVGSDSFSLALTDGAGNVLSRNVVHAAIAAGATTPIGLTLNAVTASVAVVPGAGATTDGTTSPYHVPGLFQQPVEVEALDADGNVIIGPGAPAVTTATVTTGSAYATVTSAQTSDAAAYFLRTVNATAAGQTVTVSATVQDATLGDGTVLPPVSGSTSYKYTPALLVGIAADIFAVSLESGNIVAGFPVCSCIGATEIAGLAVGTDGTIYGSHKSFEGLGSSSSVAEIPSGTEAATVTISTGATSAGPLWIDAQDNLWVLNTGGFRQTVSIAKFAHGATTPAFTISGGGAQLSQPAGLAVAANGTVYESDGAGYINAYAPGTQTPAEQLSDPSLVQPGSMTLDAAGDIYVNDDVNQDIAIFAAGQTTLTNTLSDGSFYNGGGDMPLVFDAGGNLWVSLASAGEIEELSASSLPNSVSIINYLTQDSLTGPLAIVP